MNRNLVDLENSIQKGTNQWWWVAKGYQVIDNAAVPIDTHENNLRFYYPAIHSELPGEFANIEEGNEKSVMDFVHNWGLLGYGNLLAEDSGSDAVRKTWQSTRIDQYRRLLRDLAIESLKRRGRHNGDPITWIWLHAKTIRMVLDLLDSRRKAEEQAQPEKYLRNAIQEASFPYQGPKGAYCISFAQGSFQEPKDYFISDLDQKEKPEKIVGLILTAILEPNLQYLRYSLVTHEDGSIERICNFPALLSIIYYLLADAAAGERTYIRCQYCLKYIPRTHLNQLYCPHPDNPKCESLCSLKARQRDLKIRRRMKT